MWIRLCPHCECRIRSIGRVTRARRCPACKAEVSTSLEPPAALTPTALEWTVWILGLSTEILGVLLALTVLFAHRRFSMSWLGASLVAALLAGLFIATGRVARIGSPRESIGRNVVALVVFDVLLLYGSIAFPALDALGGSFMALLAVFCIVMVEATDVGPAMRERAERARFWSWVLLIVFLAAYVYHAFQQLTKR